MGDKGSFGSHEQTKLGTGWEERDIAAGSNHGGLLILSEGNLALIM